jgi:hypothetical protein
MITAQQIQEKIKLLETQEQKIAYDKNIYNAKLEELNKSEDVIRGALLIYREWLPDALGRESQEKAAKEAQKHKEEKK